MAPSAAALSPTAAALVQLDQTSSGASEWSWRQLDPALRGAALLDPAVAQHTSFVRITSAISEEDIAVLVAAAERHKVEHAGDKIGSGNSDVQGKLYLHHNGVDAETALIVARIQRLVEATDAAHWGLLSDEVAFRLELTPPHALHVPADLTRVSSTLTAAGRQGRRPSWSALRRVP